ncbi:aspartate aminotransferase family protein [Aquibacillus albus]|uniref:Acetylornithine/succinyldiaminopimelate/putresci ne aminotransferase n=1 Tax=Aquibacillus albus TaxID=1168171 RepID=A0ABS2MWA9_9BACI|nr:aminotransferase class III-fold pyridoxal phosphate-dependent enzyme [Aquibacillus albus]MBM7570184.1 acetylornithine/succinyldiaminopimelate/putrescine aminotransferase [Aquibacillus albus]
MKHINMTKDMVIDKSIRWWNPHKTENWQELGVDLVMDKREGYYFYDMDGKQLMNLHLNGGTYNLGHRNPEIIASLKEGLQSYDIGNHHFPSVMRAELAEKLAKACPGELKYSIFSSGGGEAIDVAIKCAKYATKRRKVVSIEHCYHGHTGIAVALGDHRFSEPFLSRGDPNVYIHVPFNDINAMEKALAGNDIACVIIETIPATYGFPMPDVTYLKQVKALCEQYDTLFIADEVQTGLMRTGSMWAITKYGVEPHILVTAKGLSGGIYPIAATVVNEKAGQWLLEDGKAHMSTFGGSELGCLVALKVLEITAREDVQENVAFISDYLAKGLEAIRQKLPDFFVGVRQNGLVMGLEFDHPEGAKYVMKCLYDHGVWAIYSMLDPSVLQFKPGLLCDVAFCDELLARLEKGIEQAFAHVKADQSVG